MGGLYIPLKSLEDLGIQVVFNSVPSVRPNAALLPFLSTLGKLYPLLASPFGLQGPRLHHILFSAGRCRSSYPWQHVTERLSRGHS